MSNQDRIRELFTKIDGQDLEGFLSYLTEGASFTFGNSPTAVGKEAIGAGLKGFYESIAGLNHTLNDIWEVEGHIICRGDVSYKSLDG